VFGGEGVGISRGEECYYFLEVWVVGEKMRTHMRLLAISVSASASASV
jgi:hypothetical protein